MHALLGLVPYAAYNLLVVDPVLPAWLPAVELRNLKVGTTAAALRFERAGDGSATVRVLDRDGALHVIRQPPLEALNVGLGRRLRALLSSTV